MPWSAGLSARAADAAPHAEDGRSIASCAGLPSRPSPPSWGCASPEGWAEPWRSSFVGSIPYAGTSKSALRSVDMRLEPGRILGVVGANESGKTTLCLVAGGFAPGVVGGGWRVGADRRRGDASIPPHALAQHCGLLFQNAATQLSNTTPRLRGSRLWACNWPGVPRSSSGLVGSPAVAWRTWRRDRPAVGRSGTALALPRFCIEARYLISTSPRASSPCGPPSSPTPCQSRRETGAAFCWWSTRRTCCPDRRRCRGAGEGSCADRTRRQYSATHVWRVGVEPPQG